jgi:hypothetical protein
MSVSPERNDEPEFLGQGYDLTTFGRDLSGGKLRWLATVLAVASGVLLVGMAAGIVPMEIYYPIHIEGLATPWVVLGAFLIWTWLAFVNWRARSRRSEGERPA